MSRDSHGLVESLARRYKLLDRMRRRLERLVAERHLSERLVETMYEGLFLNACTAFEGFIENLFIGLLVNKTTGKSSPRRTVPRLTIRSHLVAHELICGPRRPYVDWLPYDNTMNLAGLFFRGGRPFNRLSEAERDLLRRSVIVRNAIAHKSRFSLLKFETDVIGALPVTARERRPSGYLRGAMVTAPIQTRYENLVSGILLIARHIAK